MAGVLAAHFGAAQKLRGLVASHRPHHQFESSLHDDTLKKMLAKSTRRKPALSVVEGAIGPTADGQKPMML
jgi:hypothetical protein